MGWHELQNTAKTQNYKFDQRLFWVAFVLHQRFNIDLPRKSPLAAASSKLPNCNSKNNCLSDVADAIEARTFCFISWVNVDQQFEKTKKALKI